MRELEVEKFEIQYEAALLAAQVHEHRVEALKLSGEPEKAEELLEAASVERTFVDDVEMALLQARLEVAKQKLLVANLKGDFAGKQKAQEEVRACDEGT